MLMLNNLKVILLGLYYIIFSNYECHLFFKTLVDKKKDKAYFKNIPKTNEEYISSRYGGVNFVDSYRFYQVV